MRGAKIKNLAKLCMALAGFFFPVFPDSKVFADPDFSAAAPEEAAEEAAARVFSVIVQEIVHDVQGRDERKPRVYDIVSLTMSKDSWTFKLSLSKLSAFDFRNSSCLGMKKPQNLGESAASKPLVVFSSSSRPPPWPMPSPFVIADKGILPLEHPFAADSWTSEMFAEALEKIAHAEGKIILKFPDHSSLNITPGAMAPEPYFKSSLCADYDFSAALN